MLGDRKTSAVVAALIRPLMAILLVGCHSSPQWTAADRQNIAHFRAAQDADLAAVRLSNRGAAFSTLSEAEAAEMLRLRRLALSDARALEDAVLGKAHPELPDHFRNQFQRSLELEVRNFEVGDPQAAIEAGNLHDQWVDWFNANRDKIRIPK